MYIFGDTHCNWNCFNKNIYDIINIGNSTNIIVVGDFGYWPNFPQYDITLINPQDCNIYFCPGNHENWDALKALEISNQNKKIIEIKPHIFYCTFGSLLELEGHKIMFCGGADSVDKNMRKLGIDWFPEEIITESDMYYLPDTNIDTIISHTAPKRIVDMLNPSLIGKVNDPSCDRLTWIHQHYRPSYWFYGHFHNYGECEFQGTRFYQLNRENTNEHIIEYGKTAKIFRRKK